MFVHSQVRTIEDVRLFLDLAETFGSSVSCPKSERAQWVRSSLLRFSFRMLSREKRGMLRQYLRAVTGYSPAQIGRHINTFLGGSPVSLPHGGYAFPRRFTPEDVELLAETDNLHGRLNGAATRKIFQQLTQQGDSRFSRLATISIGHLYNLRREDRYRSESCTIAKTKPTLVPIGERRKPEPGGQPGFIRVDSVHQGDRESQKGVYHVNLVDEVTQWQIIFAVETIAEAFLVPLLEEAIGLFPFMIRNFHSDNGSEYINKTVSRLLQKLLITQTKSRPRHSNDNGLAETKNGSVIRKHMTYHHIPQSFAARINVFYRSHLIPYVNFHRPSGFAERTVLPNGKVRVHYPLLQYQTPFERFLSLPSPEQHLREGKTLDLLRQEATQKTTNQIAKELQEAKRKLLKLIADFPLSSGSDDATVV